MSEIILRKLQSSDFPFMRKMLYEAVFWRKTNNRPEFEEGLAYPDVAKALENYGKRDGDTAVIAEINSIPVGAAWFRYWNDDNTIRGYINEDIPVAAIGVESYYRHQGIGTRMIEWLIEYAACHSINKISLAVSKDNYAINLYRQQGFKEYEDKGDWFIMVREVQVNITDN